MSKVEWFSKLDIVGENGHWGMCAQQISVAHNRMDGQTDRQTNERTNQQQATFVREAFLLSKYYKSMKCKIAVRRKVLLWRSNRLNELNL